MFGFEIILRTRPKPQNENTKQPMFEEISKSQLPLWPQQPWITLVHD